MKSPAERYAEAAARNKITNSDVGRFAASYSFEFDDFQIKGCQAVNDGHSVLVAAPTGSGKTVVGEFAVYKALQAGTRAFYTTPIKALSNQKYRDLVAAHGAQSIGLLTGDAAHNPDAPVVVMTTEVLRNMLYERSPRLQSLAYVVMDEVHYLADRQRGAVWEEVIIHLPDSVSVIALSATVSNAEEFGGWLRSVRGQTEIIVEEKRPVPLDQHVLAERQLIDLFSDNGKQVNPVLIRMAQDDSRSFRGGSRRERHRRDQAERRRPSNFVPRPRVAEILDRAHLLPAIYFIFSRQACDDALTNCVTSGVRLTDERARKAIRAYVNERCSILHEGDLLALGFYEWREALERGMAAHHAGLLPLFKEVIEELFTEGLLKLVFATETLALGINMPARSVVLERLVKWNGSAHVDVTPGEYTQLTGRAGRRGIDNQGHAITVWHRGFDPSGLAGLASKRTYPLKSSFRPSYNMAINLVSRMGVQAARDLLETSFAQYQADDAVVGIANQIRKHEQALAGYAESMTCHLGDFTEYAAIREEISQLERETARETAAARKDATQEQIRELKVGDIVLTGSGRRALPCLVVASGHGQDGDWRTNVLTLERRVRRLMPSDMPGGVVVGGHMKVPRNFDPKSAHWRRNLARALADQKIDHHRPSGGNPARDADNELRIAQLRAELRAHPCHGCADREAHARWGERYHRLARETDQLRRRVDSRTNTIARQFDNVCAVLLELGYLTGDKDHSESWKVSPAGTVLARLYADQDLLVSECIRQGVWSDLSATELAAAAAALVYESRVPEDSAAGPPLPKAPALRMALTEQFDVATELAELESAHKVNFIRRPNNGFSQAAYDWANGHSLATVLRNSELPAGDFVRWARQLLDLLGQIAAATDDPVLRGHARSAMDSIGRGVISFNALDENESASGT